MSPLVTFVLLLTLLFVLTVGAYLWMVKKYYWWGRGTPPPTGEEKRRLREEELRMRAQQMEWAKQHPRETRKESFLDNTKR
ncbi:MAG TPA: hypothetical protein VHL50_10035 [Pyrinomonadaceae bacterium]|nr:hypothetical protein [Pyrinomonadaceae bacterium]